MLKKLITGTAISIVMALLIPYLGCRSNNAPNNRTQVVINVPSATAAEGLDLQALGEMVKRAKDAADLERMINAPGSINNLDLDRDGKVDYLSVTEYGSGNTRGFSITDDLGSGNVQEVADIKFQQTGDQAVMQVQGNQQIYGERHYYHSSFSLGEVLLLAWLFRPHPVYFSPYHYGYYPPGYAVYHPVPITTYRSTTRVITQTSTIQRAAAPVVQSKVVSPNANKVATNIRAPLNNPTTTQKAFQARDENKAIQSGGFGRDAAAKRAGANQQPGAGPQPQPSSASSPRSTTPLRPAPANRPAPAPARNFNRRGRN